MNPRICTVLCVVVVLCVSYSNGNRANILDIYRKEVFDIAVTRNQRPVVVYYHKSSCIPCKNVKRLLEGFAKENSKVMDVAFVDFDKTPELRELYEIRAIPTTRAFRNGQVEGEVKGPGWMSIKSLSEKLIEK